MVFYSWDGDEYEQGDKTKERTEDRPVGSTAPLLASDPCAYCREDCCPHEGYQNELHRRPPYRRSRGPIVVLPITLHYPAFG